MVGSMLGPAHLKTDRESVAGQEPLSEGQEFGIGTMTRSF